MPSAFNPAPEDSGTPLLSSLKGEGREAIAAFKEAPESAVIVLDCDGTMWSVVMYPDSPKVHPDYPPVLRRLIGQTGATAVLTGRSVAQVRRFGLPVDDGLHVVGQFGTEHHHGTDHHKWVPLPEGLSEFDERLPQLLVEVGVPELRKNIESEKSHFRAVHYPGDLDAALKDRLLGGLEDLAKETGLNYLPGHHIVEVGPKVSKEISLGRLISLLPFPPSMVLYAGDSAPDLPAFDELDWHRTVMGVPTLKVWAGLGSDGKARADLVVSGPQGTLAMLKELAGLIA